MTGKLYQFVLVESQQRAYLIKKKKYTLSYLVKHTW